MKTIDISYAVSFGKGDGGEGEITVNVSEMDYKWMQIIKKLTDAFDSDYINKIIEEIKEEIARIKTLDPNATYKTKLYLVNDDDLTKEELLSVDWDLVNVEKILNGIIDEIYQFEKEEYKNLYEEDDDFFEDEFEEDDEYDDDEFPGVVTQISW